MSAGSPGGEVLYLDPPKAPQIATQRLLEQVLGTVPDLPVCAGGCGLLLMPWGAWREIPKGERDQLVQSGIRRTASFGRCDKCTKLGKPGIGLGRGNRSQNRNTRKITPELRAQIPEIWTEITGNGGGQKELAERLGVTRQRVTQLLDELGLPRRHLAKQRAEEFLEELEHLAGCGLGVYEISRALGLTPDDLVDRVDYLRHHGKTDLNFSTYRLEEAA